MRDALKTGYQSISDMDQESALGENFFVHVAGKTNRAHEQYVKKLKRCGQNEVFDPSESNYIVVFCPVASRVGTDIGEALEETPGGKPIILVVMHHTFDGNLVVAESRRQVTKAEVRLTVDCLFKDGKLLTCNRNDIAWGEIKKTLGLPIHPDNGVTMWLKDNKLLVAGVVLATVLLVTVIILAAEVKK